jgi:hypothetical protein
LTEPEPAAEQSQPKKGLRREDPPARPVEQVANRGFLADADPDKHYVWVSEVNDPTLNVGSYLAQGYTVSQYDPSEAKPTIGYQEYKPGDAIKSMGMVLMEVSLDRKKQLDEVGWKRADAIQETIRQRDIDPLSSDEQARFKGIKTVRADSDDRRKWQF